MKQPVGICKCVVIIIMNYNVQVIYSSDNNLECLKFWLYMY